MQRTQRSSGNKETSAASAPQRPLREIKQKTLVKTQTDFYNEK